MFELFRRSIVQELFLWKERGRSVKKLNATDKVSRVYFLRGDVKFSSCPDYLFSFKFFDRNLEILLQFYLIYRRILRYSCLKNWKNFEIGDFYWNVYKIFLIFIFELFLSSMNDVFYGFSSVSRAFLDLSTAYRSVCPATR